ncbi:hypothetical protein [Acholeplasma granularum]|uniref:hypothetical protein n=1 Tax=Acholeplasma granularum TaxID=264635 RepID=UPI0004B0F3A7|nr:hypothetical protein [Acholeplasma granularum]
MKDIIAKFQTTIDKNRLSHLYLLSGSLGVTKKRIVKKLAYLIFKNYQDNPNLEHQLEHLNHPNLVYIEKEGLSIKKEQILNLQREFSKTSLTDGPRVYIIENAETMSLSASNSLLKFLEEPKDNETIGFLLVDDMSQILDTIRSRSQVIRLSDGQSHEFIQILMDNEIEEKHAYMISRLTKDLDEAIALYADPTYLLAQSYIENFKDWIKNPSESLSHLMNQISQTLSNEKSYIVFILDTISSIILDLIHLHMNQKVQYEFMKESLLELVKSINSNTASSLILLIHKTVKDLRLPINIQLALNAFSIDFERLIIHGKA